MNEITQYIQKLEARYERVKNDTTWSDCEEYRREGRESELEDVISELKGVVAVFKARLDKQARELDDITDDSFAEVDYDALRDFTQMSTQANTLRQIVNEL